MKQVLSLLLLLAALLSFGQARKEKQEPLGYLSQPGYKTMPPRFQEWMNLVTYIATPEEKEAFLALANDRDRDLFIQIFWQQRDPTPGTEENEVRQEIIKRFQYVSSQYGRGTSKPGWTTDMGRITMILGKPQGVESFDQERGLFPAQVWLFQGDQTAGLPPFFTITFFKRLGMGDWVIYDPVSDGPAALLVNSESYDPGDYQKLYERIRELAPNLAQPSLSQIPGQVPYGYTPTPQNSLVMASVYRSPVQRVNTRYASNFVGYKGLVTVDTSTRYIESVLGVSLIQDGRRGGYVLHYSLKPKKISVDFSQDRNQYYTSFKMVANLKREGRTLYQQTRSFDLYLNRGEFDILQAGGVLLQDAFPVIAGDFQLALFIENRIGKEFSYHETAVRVPSGADSRPRLQPPVVGFKVQNLSSPFFAPYTLGAWKVSVDPENLFSSHDTLHLLLGAVNLSDDLLAKGAIQWQVSSPPGKAPFERRGEWPLASRTGQPDPLFLESLDFDFPESGYYRLTLRLVGEGGIVLDVQEMDLSISPIPRLSRPTEMYQQMTADNSFYFPYVRGLQHFQEGSLAAADREFESSLKENPAHLDALKMRLESAIRQGQSERVLAGVDPLIRESRLAFDGHRLKGQAYYQLERTAEALDEFLAANRIFNGDFQLLSLIGQAQLKLLQPEEAARAFEASLKINPDQPQVRQLLQELKKKLP